MTVTFQQIANSYALWLQYADPAATTSEAEFHQLTTDWKLQALVDAFGPEK